MVSVSIQELSFLELADPNIETGFNRCVGRGATEIEIIPLFLLEADHINKDIPQVLTVLRSRFPSVKIRLQKPFGVHDQMLDGVAEAIKKRVQNITPQDYFLIVGRGSSDPMVPSAFNKISSRIQERIRAAHISVSYLAAAEPSMVESLDHISAEKRYERVVVIPYLLFPGLLLSKIEKEVQRRQKDGQNIIHLDCLSSYHFLEQIIVERVSKEFCF
jgi:sirohydrochlorin ferrochelatase